MTITTPLARWLRLLAVVALSATLALVALTAASSAQDRGNPAPSSSTQTSEQQSGYVPSAAFTKSWKKADKQARKCRTVKAAYKRFLGLKKRGFRLANPGKTAHFYYGIVYAAFDSGRTKTAYTYAAKYRKWGNDRLAKDPNADTGSTDEGLRIMNVWSWGRHEGDRPARRCK